MHFRFIVVASVLLLAASCSSSKKTTTDNNSVSVDLDTIEVVASRENPYRASATKDFDLVHTKLEVNFNYEKQQLNGKATITLKPHFYPQYSLTLDAKQFDIREVLLVQKDNTTKPLEFSYDSLQLKIQLDKKYEALEQLKVYIDYTAKPEEREKGGSAAITEDKGLYFINPLGKDSLKPIQIWTQGETESSSCWFPTIDKPNQKMTNEVYITHPKKYVSLSNGTLISTTNFNDSIVTDYWKMDLPHAPYLVMMAIGDFAIVKDRWRDVPVTYYVEKDYAPYAKNIFGNTPEMMEFFSQKLGFDYPWQKYAQVVVRDYVSGAMENTSATLHSEILQRNNRELLDESYEDVISHELFHQWFGDLVTTESWSNTTLNEAFATYGEYIWNEYKYGRLYADFKLNDNLDHYLHEAENKNVDLIRFYYNDKEDMFDNHSYDKGGLLLHYLRKTVGDDAFYKSLELYLKTNQFKPVEVHQLRLAFEDVTGQDLNWFFNQWFLNSGHPVLDVKYSYDNDSVYVVVEQKHNTEKPLIYTLPFKIAVWQNGTASTYSVVLKKKSQTFSFKSFGKPDLIDFDSERAVLCQKTENKTLDNYIFQYMNTPLFLQRFEALKHLDAAQKEDSSAQKTLISAIQDPSHFLRKFAVEQVQITTHNKDSLLRLVGERLEKDEVADVRKAAVIKYSAQKNREFIPLFEKAIGDSSYEVSAAALIALSELDTASALVKAKLFENEKNVHLRNAVADIYAKLGDSVFYNYFEKRIREVNGFGKYSLLYYYANFLTRMSPELVLKGLSFIEAQGMVSDNHFIQGAAKGSVKRILKWFDDKKKRTTETLGSEKDPTRKQELQTQVSSYEKIVTEATEAGKRLTEKSVKKKE